MPRRNRPSRRGPRSIPPWYREQEPDITPDAAARELVRTGKASQIILGPTAPPRRPLDHNEVTG